MRVRSQHINHSEVTDRYWLWTYPVSCRKSYYSMHTMLSLVHPIHHIATSVCKMGLLFLCQFPPYLYSAVVFLLTLLWKRMYWYACYYYNYIGVITVWIWGYWVFQTFPKIRLPDKWYNLEDKVQLLKYSVCILMGMGILVNELHALVPTHPSKFIDFNFLSDSLSAFWPFD